MYFSLALRNLNRKKSRTILTGLGITLAIAFTVGLLSISEGFMSSFDRTLKKRGVDLFVFSKSGGTMCLFMGGMGRKDSIPYEYYNKLEKLPNIDIIVPVCTIYASLDAFSPELPFVVDGVPPKLLPKLRPYAEISSGRWLKENDGKSLFLGSSIAKDKKLKVGDVFTILDEDFKVIGILKAQGTLVDWKVNAPISVVQKISGKEGKIDYLMIRVKNIEKIQDLSKLIRKKFPKLTTHTLDEVIKSAKEMLSIARAIHFSVASFALLIGILFVASTMVMSISERIKELATLRVIGAKKKFIFKMIISESVLLSFIGGLFGCVGGFGLSKVINLLVLKLAKTTFLHTLVSFKLLFYGMGISILIGAVAAIFPAIKIVKMNLAESLKYE